MDPDPAFPQSLDPDPDPDPDLRFRMPHLKKKI